MEVTQKCRREMLSDTREGKAYTAGLGSAYLFVCPGVRHNFITVRIYSIDMCSPHPSEPDATTASLEADLGEVPVYDDDSSDEETGMAGDQHSDTEEPVLGEVEEAEDESGVIEYGVNYGEDRYEDGEDGVCLHEGEGEDCGHTAPPSSAYASETGKLHQRLEMIVNLMVSRRGQR